MKIKRRAIRIDPEGAFDPELGISYSAFDIWYETFNPNPTGGQRMDLDIRSCMKAAFEAGRKTAGSPQPTEFGSEPELP